MTRIGVRELRQNASRYLALVKRGQTVGVTERGELIAVLVPPPAAQRARDQLIAAGRLVPATSPSGRLRAARPTEPVHGTDPNADLLDRERAERL